jgi:hypothetical protein
VSSGIRKAAMQADFDAVLGRIRERGLDHWADPMRRGGALSVPSTAGGRCDQGRCEFPGNPRRELQNNR